jgi:hypothetical protein
MSKKQLVVDINRYAVRFTRMVDHTPEQQFTFHFKDKSDFGYKDQLDLFLGKTDFRALDWDEYSLSWFSDKTSVLPSSIFSETTHTAVFQLAFGNDIPENDIDFNRMPEFSGVNVYEIPIWVKSFFVTRFPRMILQHEGTHMMRGLLNGPSFKLKLVLSLQENKFILAAVKDTELKYYNSFEYQTVEDIIYHTAHLLQQNNWSDETGQLSIVPFLLEENNSAALAKDLFAKIPSFKYIKSSIEPDLIHQYQLLCV